MDVYRLTKFIVDNVSIEVIIPLGFLGEEDIISIQSGIFGGTNEAETDEEEKEIQRRLQVNDQDQPQSTI